MADSYLSYLECSACGARYDAEVPQNLCASCARPLLARHDLQALDGRGWRDRLATRPWTLWRYAEQLPFVLFDAATLREPYHVEGKKTMGFELAEQLAWDVPDAILYPCGGGVGLIGMWKAFDELEVIGLLGPRRPRLIAVQAEGCAPIVRAWQRGAEVSEPWAGATTVAAGLRVPKALGDFLVLRALRETGGCAVAVSDAEISAAVQAVARSDGLFLSPEGAATVAALPRLLEQGALGRDERIVLFNTGAGLKYPEVVNLTVPVMNPDDEL